MGVTVCVLDNVALQCHEAKVTVHTDIMSKITLAKGKLPVYAIVVPGGC